MSVDIFIEGGIPFVCGGSSEGNYTDSCYQYVAASDEWRLSGAMAERKGCAGYGSSESLGAVHVGRPQNVLDLPPSPSILFAC